MRTVVSVLWGSALSLLMIMLGTFLSGNLVSSPV